MRNLPTCPLRAQAFGDESSDESSSSEDESDDAVDNDDDGAKPASAEFMGPGDHSGGHNQCLGNNDHEHSSVEDGPVLLLKSTVEAGSDAQSLSVDHVLPASCDISRDSEATSLSRPASATASGSCGLGRAAGTTRSPTTTTNKDQSPMKRQTASAPAPTPASAPAPAPAEETKYQDDDEYLDSVIAELKQHTSAGGVGERGNSETSMLGASSPLAQMLRSDVRSLKLENELRRKFGSSVGPGGAGAAAGDGDMGGAGRLRRRRGLTPRGGSTPGASLALKRLVVSTPKEDWPKPPSLVGGGLGMARSEGAPEYLPAWQMEAHQGAEWFVFERSESLLQLQASMAVFVLGGGVIVRGWYVLCRVCRQG